MAEGTLLASSGIHFRPLLFVGKTTLDHVRDSKGIRSGLELPVSESNGIYFGLDPDLGCKTFIGPSPSVGTFTGLLSFIRLWPYWAHLGFYNQYWT